MVIRLWAKLHGFGYNVSQWGLGRHLVLPRTSPLLTYLIVKVNCFTNQWSAWLHWDKLENTTEFI